MDNSTDNFFEVLDLVDEDPDILDVIDDPSTWLSLPSPTIDNTSTWFSQPSPINEDPDILEVINDPSTWLSQSSSTHPTSVEPMEIDNDFDADSDSVFHPDSDAEQDGAGAEAEVTDADLLEVENPDDILEVPRSAAFNNTVLYSDFKTRGKTSSLIAFLQLFTAHLRTKLLTLLEEHTSIKIWPVVEIEYDQINDKAPPIKGYLRSRAQILFNDFQIDEVLDIVVTDILARNSNFIQERSGLIVHQVVCGTLHIAKHNPLAGSAYAPLPPFIRNKNSVINVHNTDNRCFGYAILSAIYPVEHGQHPDRPSKYDRYFEEQDLDQIQYPVEPHQVPHIEDLIQINVNLYTFSHEGRKRRPYYISKKQFPFAIDLLYWNGHYAYIKNFAGLFFDITKHEHQKHFCRSCLGHFWNAQSLANHQLNCKQGGFTSTIYTLPPPGTILKFKNIKFQQPVVFRIFADCESILEPADPATGDPFTRKHTPCAVGFQLLSYLPDFKIPYQSHRGPDCIDWFLAKLLEVKNKCLKFLFSNRRMIWDTDLLAQELYAATDRCYLCDKPFGAPNDKNFCKVRDHDHITGKFRGAAHARCNLQLRKTVKIPVFFHNFRGYDSHLIVHALPHFPEERIRVIGQSMEKYLILSWGDHIVFKDSLQFLNFALDKLAANLLKAGRDNFKQLLATYPDPEQADLLLRKGVYPYDYMDSWERFEEQQLPPKEAFFNTLKDEPISDADYQHAQKVWQKFNCANIGEYHDLYLKTDVLLLADVWEGFSATCFANYQLDPAHYVSSPHLSWDAMLKFTDAKIELLHDPEMFRFYDGGLRGGICYVPTRYAKANNPMCPDYDPTKPKTWIVDKDNNNLYGAAMMKPMPYGGFRWLSRAEIDAIDWQAQQMDQEIGYTVEVDLDYPTALHDSHNDYPLAAERIQVNYNCISQMQVDINRCYSMARSSRCTKLMPNLMDKRHYSCDYYVLKRYLDLGLKLKYVHRATEFRQSRWLMPFIEKNQNLRKEARQEHEKDLFKLLNNSVYGKTCENLKKRSDIRLVTDQAKCRKLTEKPHCQGFKIFGENLAAVQLEKVVCKIDKPTPVGFKVLEMSKLLMFEFYYDQLKVWYGDRVKLLFTDTDSLMLEIQTEDIYKDMYEHREFYDLANYPEGHPYRFTENDKVQLKNLLTKFYLLTYF